jgi:penicillin-binding protein-related factor A (putative recombinase)
MVRRRKAEQLTLPGAPPCCPSDPGLDAVLGGSVRTATATLPAPGDPGVRARAGRAAHRHGKAWEAAVKAYLTSAIAVLVLVWFIKVEPGVVQRRVKAEGGRWEWRLEWGEKAAADYAGCTVAGRALAIECKSTESGRLARAEIKPQQAAQLDAIADADGVALLAVEFRDAGRDAWGARQYLIPWRQVPWTVARSAEGLDEADAAPWRLAGGALFERLRGH